MMKQKSVGSILNKIRYPILNFYLRPNAIVDLHKKILPRLNRWYTRAIFKKPTIWLMNLWLKLKHLETRKNLCRKNLLLQE